MKEIRLFIFKTNHHDLAITESPTTRFNRVSDAIKLDTRLAMLGQLGERPMSTPHINYII